MKRTFIFPLLLCLLLSGCAKEAPLWESTPHGLPTITPPLDFVNQELPALCRHRDCFEEHAIDGVAILCSCSLDHSLQDHSGAQGVVVFIDGKQAHYSKVPRYLDYVSGRSYMFAGKEVVEINIYNEVGGYFDEDNTLLLFDRETLEQIALPDAMPDYFKIRYDAVRHALDMSAFAPSVLSDECVYEPLPPATKLNPHYDEYTRFFYESFTSDDEIDGVRAYFYLNYPLGEIEMDYLYENGRFALAKIRVDNQVKADAYEPVPGKALNVYPREPGDGREPMVTEEGVVVELGGEILGFYPDVRLDATVDDIRLEVRHNDENNYMAIMFLEEDRVQRNCYFNLDTMQEIPEMTTNHEEWWRQLEYGQKPDTQR